MFVVFGPIPYVEADTSFSNLRRTEDGRYLDESTGHRLGSSDQLDEGAVMERGLRLSLAKTPAEAVRAQRAMFLSRFESSTSTSPKSEQTSPSSNSTNTVVNSS